MSGLTRPRRALSARQARATVRAHRRRSSRDGFTLIELVISLAAGLMVAMAVMGVSNQANNTFHEEVRVSGAEMALRVSMERIRMDLQRAAFMGTGNIAGDPLVARATNYTGLFGANLSNVVGTPPVALQNLSGIAITTKGSEAYNDPAISAQLQQNGLAPDMIDIGGNFSSSDEYPAAVVWPLPGSAAAPGCAAGPAISLQMNTPAAWRIRNAESALGNTGVALEAAFHPGSSQFSQFLLRLTDQSGRYQYLLGAPGGAGAGKTTYYNAATPTAPVALICIGRSSTILKTSQTGGLGGVSGFGAGWVVVSPLQIARWNIQTRATAATALVDPWPYPYGGTGAEYWYSAGTPDPSELVLTRSYVDFSSAAAPSSVDATTTEIIAEYAVDLKFGVTIDKFVNPLCVSFPCPLSPPAYVVGTGSPLQAVSMDVPGDLAQYQPFLAQVGAAYTPNVGPQRVRDVQVRLGIRSQYPDRVAPLPPPTAASYIFRYQIPATPAAGALAYARVRENTSQVNLPNQTRFYW